MGDDNIWTDDWDEGEDWSGGGGNAKQLPRAERLGASVYELGPSNFVPYHFHHASEEMLVVLVGAHGFRNVGDEKCRYLMASSRQQPEVSEYPDLGQITVQAPTGSQTGERLWFIYDVSERDE